MVVCRKFIFAERRITSRKSTIDPIDNHTEDARYPVDEILTAFLIFGCESEKYVNSAPLKDRIVPTTSNTVVNMTTYISNANVIIDTNKNAINAMYLVV